MTLRRKHGPVQDLEPGEYTTETASGLPAISCSSCGGISDIEAHVRASGSVSFIWSCPFISCDFIDYLKLADYGAVFP